MLSNGNFQRGDGPSLEEPAENNLFTALPRKLATSGVGRRLVNPRGQSFEASNDVKALQLAHLRNRDFDVECIQRQAGALKRLRPKRKARLCRRSLREITFHQAIPAAPPQRVLERCNSEVYARKQS
ncbi:hypothetical protein B5E41_23675 [Rhizobium esperanzae]|uniref:Uncharacterized protein n=1 Tax=Rhizobium esperanzae TaxID=1967781 RepID=A0A246DPI4_9HYPH|nr:hypothetical protein B5E41_23675 [Rhizobium esperanzae]